MQNSDGVSVSLKRGIVYKCDKRRLHSGGYMNNKDYTGARAPNIIEPARLTLLSIMFL